MNGRWPSLVGFAVLAALWWLGILGSEAMMGLFVFGTIVGGDRGPGPDEPWPRRRREPDWRKMILKLMRQKKPAPPPEPTWLPPYRVEKLPPVDLEPMPSPLPLPPLERRDRKKLIKAMEEEFAKRFREVLRKEASFSEKPIDLSRGIRPTPPTLHFQMQAPQRPEEETFSQMLTRFINEPPPVEETFTERLLRFMEEPEPREETFSEKLERRLQGPADFRTEGEKRRDERRTAARALGDAPPSLTEPPRGAEEAPKEPIKDPFYERGRALRAMERARLDKWDLAKRYVDILLLQFEQWGDPGRALTALAGVSFVAGGLTAMTVAVAVGVGTVVEDIMTGGAGVADDPLSFWLALRLFNRGLGAFYYGTRIIERMLNPPSPSPERGNDA